MEVTERRPLSKDQGREALLHPLLGVVADASIIGPAVGGDVRRRLAATSPGPSRCRRSTGGRATRSASGPGSIAGYADS